MARVIIKFEPKGPALVECVPDGARAVIATIPMIDRYLAPNAVLSENEIGVEIRYMVIQTWQWCGHRAADADLTDEQASYALKKMKKRCDSTHRAWRTGMYSIWQTDL